MSSFKFLNLAIYSSTMSEVTHLEIGEFSFKLVDLSSIHYSKESFEGIPDFLCTFVILGMMNEIRLDIKSDQPKSFILLQTYEVITY
jgi:hypothetical protein